MTRERGLVRYLVGLAALLLGGELLARVFEPELAATADRVAFKAALLARQGPTPTVLIGTSRFNDGLAGAPLSAFNASVPSSSLATQTLLLAGALRHPGVKRVVLEVSPEQARPALEAAESTSPASAHLALLRQRRALALENWPRLWALPLASHLDGSEWFRDRWFREMWVERSGVGPVAQGPRPTRVAAAAQAEPSEAVSAWATMADAATTNGIAVVFVAPPVDADRREGQCGGAFGGTLAQLALQSRAPVLDYGCLELPPDLFIGNAHLGARGRAWFTRSLKAELDALQ